MLNITPAAESQIKAVLTEQDEENLHLRIAARQTPQGIEFGMGLDEVREQDMNFHCDGFEVLVGPSSRDLLIGVTLDYVEYQPGDYRFIFIPPASSCGSGGGGGCGGCGSSSGGGCGSAGSR